MKDVLEYIEKNKAAFVDELVALLRFPSVSADSAYNEGIAACAEHVRAKLASLGLSAEVVETAGHPIVYGEWSNPANSCTLLIYGHYDVQPVDPLDLWDHPPFEPHVDGDTIYARGAADDKGQFLIHLLAIEAYLKTVGNLPVNVKVVIEGEEETAADNLEDFIKQNRKRLQADGVVVSDTAMFDHGVPAITYGLRGIAAAEISVAGPGRDLHSGSFGGGLANPATEVARIAAALHDENYHVAIDGFYDDVQPVADWEREAFGALPFEEAGYLKKTGASAVQGEAGYSTFERVWARPTCEVNGIYGGYAGEGGKTIIPAKAGCKVTMRLVPDQDPDDILRKFESFVLKIASPAVTVDVDAQGGAKPAIVSRDSFLIAAGSAAFERGFGRKPVFMREGGSIPIVNVFKEELGLDTLLLGFAQHDDNIHSPNEKFSLSDFHQGIVTVAHFFDEVGRSR